MRIYSLYRSALSDLKGRLNVVILTDYMEALDQISSDSIEVFVLDEKDEKEHSMAPCDCGIGSTRMPVPGPVYNVPGP